MLGDCANCNCGHICATKGVSCTPVDKEAVLSQYSPEERKMMEDAAYVEATYYMQYTRIQETAAFAQRMGYKKIGLAFCVGISHEMELIASYFSKFSTSILFAAKTAVLPRTSWACPGSRRKTPSKACATRKTKPIF